MLDLASVSADGFWAWLQIFARVSSLLVSAPVFSSREIPAQAKVGLAGILSLALLPLVKTSLTQTVPATLYGMAVTLLGQVLIGLLMGMIVALLFAAVRLGGDLIDYQMGFTQAATFNPQFNESVSPIAAFQSRYALVLYLIGNGHLMLIRALWISFDKLPVAHLTLGASALSAFTDLSGTMLLSGLQIAAPAAAVLLLTDIAFALLNRAVPQMQVFWVGMPVKVLVGLAVLGVALPLLTYVVGQMTTNSSDVLGAMLRGLGAR